MSHDALTWPAKRSDRAELWTLQRIVDGDTIDVHNAGHAIRVRLAGIDAPESVHPLKPTLNAGRRASAYLRKVLLGQVLELYPDPGAPWFDRYGRALAHVVCWQSGLWVNAYLVSRGFARAYRQYPGAHGAFMLALERDAQARRLGLWYDILGPPG